MAHINVDNISKATAVADLKLLEEQGFLHLKRQGRHVFYYPSNTINFLFEKE